MPEARSNAHYSERMLEVIMREAAAFIQREAGPESLITVIRAQSMSSGDRVAVFVSVYPEDKMRGALSFLERQRHAFSDHLKKHARLGPLPRIDFLPDNHEATGEQIKNP